MKHYIFDKIIVATAPFLSQVAIEIYEAARKSSLTF